MKLGVFIQTDVCSTEVAAAQIAKTAQQQVAPDHPVLVLYQDVVGAEQRYLLDQEERD